MTLRAPVSRSAVDLAVAFQFLTRLPMPQLTFAPDGLARAVKFFPVVGLAIGAGAALLEKFVVPHLGRPGASIIVLIYLLLITGCLHEDGLADVADSMGGWTIEQRLNILRDSRLGTYGVVALVISLSSRALSLTALPIAQFTAYVIAAQVLCRWSMLPLSYYLPAARPAEGQGARIANRISTLAFAGATLFALATVVVLLRKAALAPILLATAVSATSSVFYLRRFQGVTGDCFGATSQLTEIAVYLCGVWQP